MTIEHNTLGNLDTKMHGIVKKSVANAAALAATVIVADDIAQKIVIRQLDTDQLWIPLTVAPTFRELDVYTAIQIANDSSVAGATVQAALNALLAGNLNPRTVVANFNFAASDAGRLVLVNSVGAIAGTIPDATFAVGDVLLMMQIGAFPGEASFVGGGVQVMLPNSLSNKTFSQYALIGAVQVSANNWVAFGNVALL